MLEDNRTNSVRKEALHKKNKYKIFPQLLAGFTANMTLFCAGMSFGWPSPSLPKLQEASSDLYLTSDEGAWIVSALLMGGCIGPFISALLVNRIGRKWVLFMTGVPCLLCWTLIYFAQSFEGLLAARFISGVGVGGAYTTVPMYLGEIAETRIRGAIGTMTTLLSTSGSLMVYCVGPWVDRKTLALVNLVPTVLFLSTLLWMPETPYYYLRKNRIDCAKKSLTWLRGTESICEELEEMSSLVQIEMKQRGRITELVTVPANRRATFIVWLLLTAQQFSGVIALLAYVSLLFEKTTLDLDPNFAVIITGLVSLLANVVAICVVEKVGKKPLFLLSAFGISLCLFTIGTYFYLEKLGFQVRVVPWVPLVATLAFHVFFALGLGPITYAILSEIYPTSIKAWATMLALMYGSMLAVVISKTYQIMADHWGYHTVFYGLCVCEVSVACIVFVVIPETKGKSFKEIQEILNEGNGKIEKNLKC